MRAKARTARREIGERPDSGRVLIRPELGDDPDRWAPPVGGLREGEAGTGWAGVRRWAGGGESLAREGERKKKRERNERLCIFFLKLIRTIQFKFKFREFKFKLNNKQ